jgi:hypothetical protein
MVLRKTNVTLFFTRDARLIKKGEHVCAADTPIDTSNLPFVGRQPPGNRTALVPVIDERFFEELVAFTREWEPLVRSWIQHVKNGGLQDKAFCREAAPKLRALQEKHLTLAPWQRYYESAYFNLTSAAQDIQLSGLAVGGEKIFKDDPFKTEEYLALKHENNKLLAKYIAQQIDEGQDLLKAIERLYPIAAEYHKLEEVELEADTEWEKLSTCK